MMAWRGSAAASTCGLWRLFSKTAYSYVIASDKLQVGQIVMNCGTNGAVSASHNVEPNTDLLVSGLNKGTTSQILEEAFSKFGEIVHATVVSDRVTGHSKGFAFVEYATLQDAAEGVKGMDGKHLDGSLIFANYAQPKRTLL